MNKDNLQIEIIVDPSEMIEHLEVPPGYSKAAEGMIEEEAIEVYNTGIETKRKYFEKFIQLIRNQFWHGGEKYLLEGQENKEFTDLVCEVSPGKTGFDWILQTIVKYCGRYINFQREKDLLKIATYAYIAWLKSGAHLKEAHDEDTNQCGTQIPDDKVPEGTPEQQAQPFQSLYTHIYDEGE